MGLFNKKRIEEMPDTTRAQADLEGIVALDAKTLAAFDVGDLYQWMLKASKSSLSNERTEPFYKNILTVGLARGHEGLVEVANEYLGAQLDSEEAFILAINALIYRRNESAYLRAHQRFIQGSERPDQAIYLALGANGLKYTFDPLPGSIAIPLEKLDVLKYLGIPDEDRAQIKRAGAEFYST